MRRSGLFVLACVLLVACTSNGEEPEAPEDDAAAYRDELVAFTVVDGFEQTPAGEELQEGLEVEFLRVRTGEELVPEQIVFGYAVPDDPNFTIAAWPVFAFGPMQGDDEQLARDEVDVPGAREALRVSYRLTRLAQPGLDEPVRIEAVAAIVDGPDGPVIADLRYIAVESEFDEDVATRVLESLRASR